MIDSLVAGKGRYEGIMADHEVERFRIWEEIGDEMVVSGHFPNRKFRNKDDTDLSIHVVNDEAK